MLLILPSTEWAGLAPRCPDLEACAGTEPDGFLQLSSSNLMEFDCWQDLTGDDMHHICHARPGNFPAVDGCIPSRYLLQCATAHKHAPLPAHHLMAAVQVGARAIQAAQALPHCIHRDTHACASVVLLCASWVQPPDECLTVAWHTVDPVCLRFGSASP